MLTMLFSFICHKWLSRATLNLAIPKMYCCRSDFIILHCIIVDPAVGAKPGEVQHGAFPHALLPGQPAGLRAAQSQEPVSRRFTSVKDSARTSGDFLCLIFPCFGE